MSKQEEIKEKVLEFTAFLLDEIPPKEARLECITNATNKLLEYLHSQGVVIKVERELPLMGWHPLSNLLSGVFKETQQDMKEAGYEAVESLIEK